jgi:hyperosmotically inducible protein
VGALCVQPAAPQSDATRASKGERPTADQAKNSAGDRDLIQKIRHSIVSDKSLSTYAHNVKVIAREGEGDFEGPGSLGRREKAIETKATEVAGAGNVVDELTVKESGEKGSSQQ